MLLAINALQVNVQHLKAFCALAGSFSCNLACFAYQSSTAGKELSWQSHVQAFGGWESTPH